VLRRLLRLLGGFLGLDSRLLRVLGANFQFLVDGLRGHASSDHPQTQRH
jgi:hypothetical protein